MNSILKDGMPKVFKIEQAQNGGWVISEQTERGTLPFIVGAFSTATELAAFIVQNYGADK